MTVFTLIYSPGQQRDAAYCFSFQHPGFDISTLVNNVALLRLSENVIFNGNKIAAKIPAIANETIDDQVQRDRSYPCYVTGWGYYIDDNGR